MTDPFFDPSEEPSPVCGNCDCYSDGKCVNRFSLWFTFNPQPIDGCQRFFPDHERWPNASKGTAREL
jgi:hypothetical protein